MAKKEQAVGIRRKAFRVSSFLLTVSVPFTSAFFLSCCRDVTMANRRCAIVRPVRTARNERSWCRLVFAGGPWNEPELLFTVPFSGAGPAGRLLDGCDCAHQPEATTRREGARSEGGSTPCQRRDRKASARAACRRTQVEAVEGDAASQGSRPSAHRRSGAGEGSHRSRAQGKDRGGDRDTEQDR